MKRKIKMVGLDLDGTLLNEQKKVSPHTWDVLSAAMEKGVTVLVATGRPLAGVPAELLRFPGMRYVLTANGARITDQQSDKILYERLLDPKDAEKVLDIFAEYDTLREVFHDGNGYMDRTEGIERFFDNPLMKDYTLATRKPVDNMKEVIHQLPRGFDKVRAVFSSPSDRAEAWQRIYSETGLTVTDAISNDIEVNRAGVNKGSALLQLGELLDIRQEEIMACGDGMNDLEMISRVGLGVAMENGIKEVKLAAEYITDTNDNEGVAKAIEKFVLN